MDTLNEAVLYENNNYTVHIGEGKVLLENNEFSRCEGYFIKNKVTGLIEGSVRQLPSAILSADHFDAMLTAKEAEKNQKSEPEAAFFGGEDVTIVN